MTNNKKPQKPGASNSAKKKSSSRPALPKPRGKPPSLDVATIRKIAIIVRQGNRFEVAAQSVGVTKRRLMFWLEMGHKAIKEGAKHKRDRLYIRFVDEMHKAMAIAEKNNVSTITKASKEDWKAAAFMLTHGPAKAEYAPIIEKKSKVEGKIEHDHIHAHQHQGTLTLTTEALDKMSLEDKKRILELYKQQKQLQTAEPLALPAPEQESEDD